MLDLGPRTHITEEHVKELNMLKIPNRAKQLRLNTAHKIFYNKAPSYLNTNFLRGQGTGGGTPQSLSDALVVGGARIH